MVGLDTGGSLLYQLDRHCIQKRHCFFIFYYEKHSQIALLIQTMEDIFSIRLENVKFKQTRGTWYMSILVLSFCFVGGILNCPFLII